MIHELKCEKEFFEDCTEGRKPFEVRKADRPFTVGDFLGLNEVETLTVECVYGDAKEVLPAPGEPEYTGRCALFIISYVLNDPRFVKEGYCILGLRPAFARYSWHNESQMTDTLCYGAPVYDRDGPPEYSRSAY